MDELYFYKHNYCFDFVKKCELEIIKIKKLDTLVYVNTSQAHGHYEEIHGKLTKINDSLYLVKPFKHYIQRGNRDKPFRTEKDTIFFYCDSSLINTVMKIEYSNGKLHEYKIYSTENKFHINEDFFRKREDKLYLSFNHKNPIVDEVIEITSTYNDPKYSVAFNSVVNSKNFYIILKKDEITSLNIGTKNHQNSGIKFNIPIMSENFSFPQKRKLYK